MIEPIANKFKAGYMRWGKPPEVTVGMFDTFDEAAMTWSVLWLDEEPPEGIDIVAEYNRIYCKEGHVDIRIRKQRNGDVEFEAVTPEGAAWINENLTVPFAKSIVGPSVGEALKRKAKRDGLQTN